MARKWSVALPITGIAYVEVEAEDEEAAIEEAMNIVDRQHLEEWESHKQICRGNVFSGALNEAYADEVVE